MPTEPAPITDGTSLHARRLRPVPLGLAAGAYIAGLAYFFWPTFRSAFTLLPGEAGDPRLISIVLEHWYQVFLGLAPWRDPPYFFPQRGVLGYGDSLFLFMPAYIALRVAGSSALNAYFGVLVVVMAVGYASGLWLLRHVLGVARPIAIVGALAFTFSNMNALANSHTQLYAAAFVPLIIGLVLISFTEFAHSGRYFRTGALVAALVPLLLYTSFYVGWFTVFLLATWALVLMVITALRAPAEFRGFLDRLREERWLLFALVLVFFVALSPFLITYLPVQSEFGKRFWGDVSAALPAPADFVNLGQDNLWWGWLVRAMVPSGRPMGHELTFGLPPLMLGTFVVVLALWIGRLRVSQQRPMVNAGQHRTIVSLGVAVVISWLLMVQVGSFSLWHIVFEVVPGAGALRAPFRYQVVLHAGVIVVAAVGLDQAQDSRGLRVAVAILLAALVFEQLTAFRPTFDAKATARRVDRISAPPEGCHYFLVAAGTGGPTSQLDAAVIAQRVGIPTINGYSGQFPRGWDLWWHAIGSPGYANAVLAWMRSHNLREGLCLLDLKAGTWRSRITDPRGLNLVRAEIEDLAVAQAVELKGFHGLEPPGRWTDGAAVVGLATPISATMLRISGWAWSPGAQVRIAVDGTIAFAQALPAGAFKLDLPQAGSVRTITIDSSTFVPRLLGINDDPRQLGVMLDSITIE